MRHRARRRRDHGEHLAQGERAKRACSTTSNAGRVTAALGLLALAASGCSAGATARALRPAAPTYAEATGERRCRVPSDHERPLVVDLDPRARTDLEVAMKQGIVAVAYDCNTIRILPDCRVAGRYRYLGVTFKEQKIQLDDADELGANLPFSGGTLGLKLDAAFKRGASLQVQLLIVGKQVSDAGRVVAGGLQGACQGATHYVSAATVGGFVLKTVTRAHVEAEAGVAGAGGKAQSTSEKGVENRDGDPDTCRATSSRADDAPPGCGAVLSLDLRRLSPTAIAAASADLQAASGGCPRGWVATDEFKCVRAGTSAPHLCEAGQREECRIQCQAGHLGSCVNYGAALLAGVGRGRVPSSDEAAEAGALFARACTAGVTLGCSNLGYLYAEGVGVGRDLARATELYREACLAGNAAACGNLSGLTVRSGDHEQALWLAARGCAGQDGSSCTRVGHLLVAGKGRSKRAPDAERAFGAACSLGHPAGCHAWATLQERRSGPSRDVLAVHEYTCAAGVPKSCLAAAIYHVKGKAGLVPNAESSVRALALLVTGCQSGDDPVAGSACDFAATLLAAGGPGTPPDATLANVMLANACARGVRKACLAYRRRTGSPVPSPPPPLPGGRQVLEEQPSPAAAESTTAAEAAPGAAPEEALEATDGPAVANADTRPEAMAAGGGWLVGSMVALGTAASLFAGSGVAYSEARSAASYDDREAFDEAKTIQRALYGTAYGFTAIGAAMLLYYLLADHRPPAVKAAGLGLAGPGVQASWRF